MLTREALHGAAETSVLALAVLGDEAAFAELVRRRQSSVRQLLRRLSRDPALADDLAQQVFLQMWRGLRNLHAPGAFGAWLRKLTVNAWLQHLRANKVRLESMDDCANDERADTDLPQESSASAQVASVQMDLDAALAKLAPDARLCVVLAYHEGMSHAEIGEATGLPLGTIKSHINRGAQRLRQLLHSYQSVAQG